MITPFIIIHSLLCKKTISTNWLRMRRLGFVTNKCIFNQLPFSKQNESILRNFISCLSKIFEERSGEVLIFYMFNKMLTND